MIKVLVVEDDNNLAYLIKENLESNSYEVVSCNSGEQALRVIRSQNVDIIILDVMLPGMDGFTLANEIRKINIEVPFLFLTARVNENDKIEGFTAGAEDYVTKPFSIRELLFRLKVISKRYIKNEEASTFRVGELEFNSFKRELKTKEKTITLNVKEAELLKIFLDKPDQLISRNFIMKKIWGHDEYYLIRSMDVYITRLRKILRKHSSADIVNVYGMGFILNLGIKS